ncbi:hypothetical protein ABZU02_04225 [Gardnerella piotii]|uniref:Uncharacterized protein n=1 Tax=Gardnerella piotii TaxID=2792977 RepID=A0AAU8NPH5_9BIFI
MNSMPMFRIHNKQIVSSSKRRRRLSDHNSIVNVGNNT